MAITKVPVTGSVVLPDDSAFTDGVLTFTLSETDTESDAVLPTGKLSVILDGADIPAGLEIWRNTRGLKGTYYTAELTATVLRELGGGKTLSLRRTYSLGTCQVGNAAAYTLGELLGTPVGDAADWARQVRYFETRAELVTWAGSNDPYVGQVIFAEGISYRFIDSGTAIGDMPGWVIQEAGSTSIADDAVTTAKINNDAVTNAKLAEMAQATFKMRASGAGTGNPIDGTATQAKTALAIVGSDVTMSGGGTAADYAGFSTRAAFVTWASGKTPATGTVVFAAGDGYRYIASGTAISDLAGWVPLEVSRLTHWPTTLAGLQAAMTYCAGKKLIIPAGSYSYTLTADLTFNGINNIVIEGEGRGIANLTFTHALSFMRILRGSNITVRNLSMTVNCTFVGSSNTAFVDFRNSSFLMDNCNYSTNADISSTRYHFIGLTPDTAVSCDDFTISNCTIDKIGYLLLKGTSSLSTHKRIRFHSNVITNAQKEPLSLNAPLGSVDNAIITDNFCDGHLAGLDATDGHWLGVAGAKRFVITGNVLIGNTREGIHAEDGSEGGIIANNTLYMDFTGLTSTAMIAVLPGLAGAGDMSSNIVISGNVMKQTGASKLGWGVTVYDFTSGLQANSSKHVKVFGNIAENCEFGFDVFGGAVTGNEVIGNTAISCKIGFLHRYENQDTYRGNTSKDCDYGVATYSIGRFTDHVFNQCTALVGSKNVAAGVVALDGFTVIKADRNFTIGSSFGYAIGAGFDSSARTSMDVAVMMNGITQATYVHKTMRADWDGTTLTSTAGISRAVNATATLAVSTGVLTATVGVTDAENNCRFSAKFNGTALLSAAVIP